MIYLFFILGAIFGSFISLVSYRLPRNQDIFIKRSQCPKCKYKLGIKDLFPILSWLISAGKCQHCNNSISIRYPLIEIFTGFLFAVIIITFGINNFSILLLILSILLITIITIDLEHYIIPDSLQIIFLITALIWSYISGQTFITVIFNCFIGFSSAFTISMVFKYIRKKDGLGFGDVKFIAIATIFLGYENLLIFYFIAGLIGVIHGLTWLYLYKNQLYPFAPSLCISFFLCLIILYFFVNLENDKRILNIIINNLLEVYR